MVFPLFYLDQRIISASRFEFQDVYMAFGLYYRIDPACVGS
jgi:hypothetical protein